MKKYYASYELAKLAKDAGFDEECNMFYYNEILKTYYPPRNNSSCIELGFVNAISAPELTHLQQWVYEKFKVWITAELYEIAEGVGEIYQPTNIDEYFDCPYKALECGLLQFLKSKTHEKA